MNEVPAHLQPYVDVLGNKDALEFLLTFGGAPVYLADRPQPRSQVVAVVGMDKAKALARRFGAGHVRVPTAKPWIARQLRMQGLGTNAIARRLHMTDATVRGYLRPCDPRQMNLFD